MTTIVKTSPYQKMTKAHLVSVLNQKSIPHKAGLTKDELISLLDKHQKEVKPKAIVDFPGEY